MANEPTIVIGHLNDQELKNSIDKLVQHVEAGTQKMVTDFNAAIANMKRALADLGNTKVDMGGSSDGGSTRRARAQKTETQAVKDTVAAYDQLASAQQKATKKKGIDYISLPSDVDKSLTYLVNANKDVDAQLSSILQKEQELLLQKQREAQVSKEIAEAQARAANGLSGRALGYGSVHDMQVGNTAIAAQAKNVDYLRQQIAAILNIKERDVQKTNIQSASYDKLNAYLKQLQNAYHSLPSNMLKTEGTDIANEIQRVKRAIQQFQSQMTRPISLKSALGLSEKTLDDIAYKIKQLQAYKMSIDITKPNAATEIKQVNNSVSELEKTLRKYMATGRQVNDMNNALARSLNYMKNRLAFYFTVGASTQFVKTLIDIRSQYEMNERALGILIGSAERGTQIFQELSNMALVSPYTLIELSTAAKQLTAYDVAARDVVDTTRRLADMAAAVGIPIDRLTYALGQIRAYGYLNARDARMFSNAGIPLVRSLAEHYTQLEGKMVRVSDVYDRIKKKTIGYNDVMQVVNELTDEGGKFFDFQAKMADTLKVRLANLTLAWNNMLNEMGKESQGLITWTINALKELFLHWKQLDNAINAALWVVGIRTAFMLLYYSALKAQAAITGVNSQMALSAVFGKRLATIIKTVAASFKTLVTNRLTWFTLLAFAAVDATRALTGVNEAQEQLNKSLREGAADNHTNIQKFLDDYNALRKSLYTETKGKDSDGNDVTLLTSKDIDKGEASKAWEAIREQIELTTKNADEYVGRLLRIENVSERVRQGFNLLDEISEVNAAMKELDDDTIKIQQDWSRWWNLWMANDSLLENLGDLQDELDDITKTYGSLEAAMLKSGGSAGSYETVNAKTAIGQYNKALETLNGNLKDTKESLISFINGKGWAGNTTKIDEVFSQFITKFTLENNLDPKKAFTLQLAMEDSRTAATKQALEIRIKDEQAALAVARNENEKADIQARLDTYNTEYKFLTSNTERSRVYWRDFTKWMSEQHKSEIQAMFRGMNAEQIKALDFSKGKYYEWATNLANKYAKEHNIAYDEVFKNLKNYILTANQWSIRIPLIITTEESKSIYETLEEADSAIDAANKKIERLNTRKKELELKGGATSKDIKVQEEYAKVEEELASAQIDYNAALAKGGHSKKEDAAARKAQKQAESELQKALKEEISLIDKARNTYKTLTKEGLSSTEALTIATSGFDESIASINKSLAKFGLAPFDLSKYAGVSNPRGVMDMLQAQLDKLMRTGAAKPQEIKDLQVKLKDLKVDSITFDHKTFTDSLNNELGKLKDEYELAVELDANPELGDMFASMFGVDTSGFPQGIDDYMNRVRDIFDRTFGDMSQYGANWFDVFNADDKAWQELANAMGITEEAMKDMKKPFEESRKVVEKWATDVTNKTKDLEYKLADTNGKIAIEEQKLANLKEKLAKETNEVQKHYLELQVKDQEDAISKLRQEIFELLPAYQAVFGGIAEHSASVARRLALTLKTMLETATVDDQGNYVVKDPTSGKTAPLDKKARGRQLDKVNKELLKTQPIIDKIKEAFTESSDHVVDFAQGIEYISEELNKLGDLVSTIGDIGKELGFSEETTETISDVAATISGVSQAAQGYAKMQSGDVIGGTADMLKGTWTAVSAWLDNKNKKIDRQIKQSESVVNDLQMAYKKLEDQVEQSMGNIEIATRRTMVTNLQAQLQEEKRQLELAKSRSGKKRDDDEIRERQQAVNDLEKQIQDTVDGITSTLLGTDIKSAAEEFVSTWVSAWRQGEDVMDGLNSKFDDMIDNMIMKSLASKLVANRLKPLFDVIDSFTGEETDQEMLAKLRNVKGMMTSGTFAEDINKILTSIYGYLGIGYGSGAGSKSLSALQQGIQGITETTANALEGYMNGVSQQVYLHSDYLRQIAEVVTGDGAINDDIKVASLSRILLQLQDSYRVQMSIETILAGWSSADGLAVKVAMV